MLQLVFDKAAIKHNIATVKKRAAGAAIYAHAAQLTATAPDWWSWPTCCGTTASATSPSTRSPTPKSCGRRALWREEILMLRSTTDPEELEPAAGSERGVHHRLLRDRVALNALAEERSHHRRGPCAGGHRHGAGGISALGAGKAAVHLQIPAQRGHRRHLHPALLAGGDINAQMSLFQSTLDTLHAEGLETGVTHAASSLGADPLQGGSWTRCGWGAPSGPVPPPQGGRAAQRLPRRGHPGHGALAAQGPHRGALSAGPAGPAHPGGGDLRRLPQRLRHRARPGTGFWAGCAPFRRRRVRRVTFEGAKARILGPIGADETAIDVTDLKCTAGDVVCFDINPFTPRGMARVFR